MNQSYLDAVLRFMFGVSVAFLCFVAGTAATYTDSYKSVLRQAFAAGSALYFKVVAPPNLWFPARFDEAGVTRNDLPNGSTDLVLFTTNEAKAHLMNRSGEILHEWHLPFSAAWPEGAHLIDPAPDEHIYWRRVHVFPNGDLLAIYEGIGMSPYGGGMVKIDRDSNLIWKFTANVHHDFDFDEHGNIYALAHRYRNDVVAGIDELEPPLIEDYIAVISPDGVLLRELSIPQAIATSRYRGLLGLMPTTRGDVTHTNNLEILDGGLADRFPQFAAGQILVSMLKLNTIAVIDPDEQAVTWAAAGLTVRQHDPDFLPNGRILLFDNHGHDRAAEGASRVVELDPDTLEVAWSYAGSETEPLFSENRASQQRLANGNTFITESTAGRLLEVTPTGDIVWEYVTPRRYDGGDEISIVCSGILVRRDDLTFLKAL